MLAIKLLKNLIEELKFLVIGLLAAFIVLLFTLFSVPIYIFRFLVINYLSKFKWLRPQNLRKPVTLFGNMTALEFWGNNQPNKVESSSRCAIVTSFVVRGTVTTEELLQQIQIGWLNARDSKNGQHLYPEFKQYIESWLGFMFWHQETQFIIEDHVKIHDDRFHSEQFLCKLMENLLNTPFKIGKSPWEFHLIRNYENEANTAFVLRIHHGLADGYAIIRSLLDGILEIKELHVLDRIICEPKENRVIKSSLMPVPYRLFRDLGYLGNLYLEKRSFWQVPDSKKLWYQFYARSSLIPVSKVKCIKNRFQVSFTAVLLAALCGALSKFEDRKRLKNVSQKLPFLFLLPVSNRSKSLTNDFTATVFDLPVNSTQDPISRLVNMENLIKKGKGSFIPLIARWLLPPIALAQLAPIAKFMTHNHIVPCGLTSLRTSDLGILEWKGRKILECDFSVGGALGVTGIAFMVQSYGDQIRFGVTAEKGLVTRRELNEFIGWAEQEIEMLCDI